MSIADRGTGLKTVLAANVTDLVQIFAPNELTDTPNEFPCAMIIPGNTEYDADFQGDFDVAFRLIVLVGRPDVPSAMNKILDFMDLSGTSSIYKAVNDNPTLDGSADTSRVLRSTGVGFTQWGVETYISAEFEITAQ